MPRNYVRLIYLLLTIVSIAAYLPVTHCDFVGQDDKLYVTQNVHIMKGITWEALRWAFTNIYAYFWHPLTMISLMLDFQLFGLNPHGFHLTNLLFHILSTLLLFFVLHRMTKAPWKSAFAAALFAVHPLNVESVAWVAERKNVLSTFFWMLTMVAYVLYVERPRLKTYLITFTLFVMGLMAKPMLVTVPFVLVLLDYWPLKRFANGNAPSQSVGRLLKRPSKKGERRGAQETTSLQDHTDDTRSHMSRMVWLLIEKLPFFAMVPLCSVLAYIAEEGMIQSPPWNSRISNALVSYVVYIGKMLWPAGLAALYPHPGLLPFWQVAGAVIFLVSITCAVIHLAKKCPYLIIGWLWFLGTLVPVIGIVQISNIARADRFTYIPMIGLFIIVAWAVPELLQNWRLRREALVVLSLFTLTALCFITQAQVGYWQNDMTLFDHALKVTDNNYVMYVGRACAYIEIGDYKQAIKDCDMAIKINPAYGEAFNNRGNVYFRLGNYEKAISDYKRAIEINPQSSEALSNMGSTYFKLGDYRQAISDLDLAVKINPDLAPPYNSRGLAYAGLGNYDQAISDFDKAIEINPSFAGAYFNRGVAHGELGKSKQAIEDLQMAAKLGSKTAKNFLKSQSISW